MPSSWHDIKREIFDRLGDRIGDLVPELEPRKPGSSRSFTAICPDCRERRAFLYVAGPTHPEPRIRCNRVENCGYSKTLLDYLMERDGVAFIEKISELAEIAGVAIPHLSEEARENWERVRKEKDSLERFNEFFQETLWSDDGKDVLEYLRGRGYSDGDIRSMEMGCFPGAGETISFQGKVLNLEGRPGALKWMTTEDGRSIRDDYRLVFPYRGMDGTISTFMGRLIRPLEEGEKESDKYKPLGDYEGLQKRAPFGLYAVRGDTTTVVEGFLDALIAMARGIPNVVALTNSRLLEGQEEAFRKHGIKKILLALDNDKAGKDGTESIIRKLANTEISVFVVNIRGAKDPDESITRKGEEAFQSALEEARVGGRGIKWVMEHIGERHDLQTDEGRDGALREAEELIKSLRNPLDVQDATDYLGVALGMAPSVLEGYLRDYRERFQKHELSREIQRCMRDVQPDLEEHPSRAIETMREQIRRADTRERASVAENLFPPFDMEDFKGRLTRAKDGLKAGYKDLDARARFHRGAVTLVAGRQSHGKTATLLNFLRRQIEMEPGKRHVFVTYEEDYHQIITKLLISMSNRKLGDDETWIIPSYQKFITGEFTPSYEDEKESLPRVKQQWELLQDLLQEGKLIISYRPGNVRELSQAVRGLRDKYGEEMGAVFIDYMQIIPVPEDMAGGSMAYQKVQGISATVRDLAVETGLPIIAGAQLNRRATEKTQGANASKKLTLPMLIRPEYLREAGDLEQDANLILGIYNRVAGALEDKEGYEGNIPDFSISIMKNRNGPVWGDPVELYYDRGLWRLDGINKNNDKKTFNWKTDTASP